MAIGHGRNCIQHLSNRNFISSAAPRASLDRYTAIRDFFRTQNRTTEQWLVRPARLRSSVNNRHYSTLHPLGLNLSEAFRTRNFHTTSVVLKSRKGRNRNLDDNSAIPSYTHNPSSGAVDASEPPPFPLDSTTVSDQPGNPAGNGQPELEQDRPQQLNGHNPPAPNEASHDPLHAQAHLETPLPQHAAPEKPPYYTNYSGFFRRIAVSLPHLQRPSLEAFLKVTDGFWHRARVRFKWFTIRSFRPFNADDMSAFITAFLWSQTLWIMVWTTTFVSVVFWIINGLRLQNFVAKSLSDYLTSETGVTVVFESAVVPKWKDSRISFKNVFISRRPKSQTSSQKKYNGYRTAVGYDVSDHPGNHSPEEEEETLLESDEDTNYTMYDLNIDSIDVTLSLWRWFDGRGLIEDAVVKGVRGVLDRRSVHYDPDDHPDPAAFRRVHRSGDFELDALHLEDILITVHQPGGFRPYTASIFKADMRQFRKQYMFYDLLCADMVVGQFDNCLFSLHKPQSIGRSNEKDRNDGDWDRMSRIRIDGVSIDHLQHAASMEGPVAWIKSGKMDAVFDIKFPRDPSDRPLNEILEEIADAISTSFSAATDFQRIPGQRELAKPPLSAPAHEEEIEGRREMEEGPKVVVDIDLRFRDVKAIVPIFTNDLSYVSNALARPIVAFMNANRTLVPIHCTVVKHLEDFNGSWTMWECGLTDEISLQIYDALAYHVTQANMNRRIRTVSVWSLQKTAGAVLSTMRNFLDPGLVQLREKYMNSLANGDTELYEMEEELEPIVVA